MVRLPWRSDPDPDPDDEDEGTPGDLDVAPVVDCSFQDGTLLVYEDHVHIERPDRSRFDDRTVPMDEITGVEFDSGITIGYLQVRQVGFESDSPGFLSDPVDANTVHFGRTERGCATDARDAILERATG
jgi:hypothetical protein